MQQVFKQIRKRMLSGKIFTPSLRYCALYFQFTRPFYKERKTGETNEQDPQKKVIKISPTALEL
jgi:hypothetical protein